MSRVLVTVFVLGCQVLLGCSGSEADANPPNTTLAAPIQADFPKVGDALQLRCGTLDCHGQIGRNLRLYGFGGLRLPVQPDELKMGVKIDFANDPTREAEQKASYNSIIGLEPEALSQVSAGLADPNQLAMVRKTRGIEKHKGGKLANVGDSLDSCIVLWLTRRFDPFESNMDKKFATCVEVINATAPDPLQIPTP